ncbi:Fe(3+) ABC transporter substrate-binding protein [Methyloceanibacter caenitepidi]|uniref:Ferric iron ABC transporter, iron-binding protein n=1 Tax=Methyloceanibacter caenitepidi TaxID=1384459 RepID=A0A0A8K2C3_9HYPH|nr:Fe(3+) ABC transporter substrate-binding protein [Methyloceanibacter caenitepidi]BAQ16891.1 ferric iron ABC transporter, iron-binding protein [Methyloceanibacter caenitepidi]
MRWTFACAATAAALLVTSATHIPARAEAPGEVNIYSYRQPYLIEPLLEEFSAETGIKTNVIFAEKGLIERIQAEGRNSPADLLLTTDIGNLSQAVASGISQPVTSATIDESIPASYRGTDDEWIGLTRRARVVYASKDRVEQNSITYEELADPKWRGKICIRSGQHPYNVALVASMIAHLGPDETETWLRGVKANLARKPAGNDRLQVKGVYAGECDLAIGNTYYMGKMLTDEDHPEQKEWAESVKMLFPNTNGRGTHVNVSGVVLAKNAPNKDNALKLIEFLASDTGQNMYAEVNHEYPTKDGVPWSDLVESWGTFKADPISLNEIAELRKAASEMIDKVGFDDGPSS